MSALSANQPASSGRLGPEIPRTLVMTGHFPPARGGVQTFTWELLRRMPAEQLLVVAPAHPEAATFDRSLPFPVVRRSGYWLTRRLRSLVGDFGCTAAWIPAVAPIGLFAPRLQAAGVGHLVGSTHGQELGWIHARPTRTALRRTARRFDVITYLSDVTRAWLEPLVDGPTALRHLAGAVDTDLFRPGRDPAEVRRLLGLRADPLVTSVARLVRRKGHDRLLAAWPRILDRVPEAQLVIIGDGPLRQRLTAVAAEPAMHGSVRIVPELPARLLADLVSSSAAFVLPCRDARAGLQTEGLGLAVLEASACGVPVVVGRSGGSAETVRDARTGHLVDANDPTVLTEAVLDLLENPRRARLLGQQGRDWVLARWSWDRSAAVLRGLLAGAG